MDLRNRRPARLGLLLACTLLPACHGHESAPLFRRLSSRRTGVTFANTLTPSAAHNLRNDIFFYNGAGVATGDVNGDGLPDIFLSGNMVSSRLYLNRGDYHFQDVTEAAGVATHAWATGVALADVNGDGKLDIYVSVSGPPWSSPLERKNLLFVNQGTDRSGIPHFVEEAEKHGIADTGFSTNAVFLDYDRDGYPDLYVLNNSPEEFGRGQMDRTMFGPYQADPAGFDQLYHNNGNGTFTNVSEKAGILRRLGYGLGVAVADLNRDGWPDIYVSNDISSQDVLYINNGNGTFTDRAAQWLAHTSYAGMGNEIADFNNDGWPDIMQLDMMAADLVERKRISGSVTRADLKAMTRGGGVLQYNLNTLQLNQGTSRNGQIIFSEIARQAGVSAAGWSWSPLFADFDNDGWKDLFVTSGYPKALIDYDYETDDFMAQQLRDTARARQRQTELMDRLSAYRLPSHVFRNDGNLSFSDMGRASGVDQPGIAYGAAYADLNNDGRLDLVVNNLDAPAAIFENVGAAADGNHYLEVRLDGAYPNGRGLGARLVLTAGTQTQYLEASPYHGFMSTSDDRPHFGLGRAQRVDSLRVIWPDGREQLLTGLRADEIITVHQRDAAERRAPDPRPPSAPMFRPLGPDAGLNHQSRENDYLVDYTVQPLLPYQVSRQGPPLAVADVDGDGLDDVFVGGSAGFPGHLFLQQRDGRFVEAKSQPWAADKDADDWGALFFDANGDGRPDLYVASGGYRVPAPNSVYQDRLYVNQGHGRFAKDPAALPAMLNSKAAVVTCDFNGDGKPDLFVGGRLTPRNYPSPTRSYILRNDGGRFTDVTRDVASELLQPGGMVTAAVCMDFNGDGRMDLVTAGEWMPIQFYGNDGTHLRNVTSSMRLPPMRGWWYSLGAGDFDHDGRMDLVAGNLGLNYSYTTSSRSRFGVYAADFAEHGISDVILTQEVDGTEYPYYGLALLGGAISELTVRYPTFKSFASASVQQIFGSRLRSALHYQADTFASMWLHNDGNGTFTPRPLPPLAQISPIRCIIAHDVDGDGNLDLIVAGNLYETEANTARADAGKGLWLKGDGRGGFTPVPPSRSGFLAPLDVRGCALIHTPTGNAVVVANNNGPLQAFALAPGQRPQSLH